MIQISLNYKLIKVFSNLYNIKNYELFNRNIINYCYIFGFYHRFLDFIQFIEFFGFLPNFVGLIIFLINNIIT